MTEHSPEPHEHVHAKSRTIGVIHGDDCRVFIEHVYLPDGAFACDECGEPGHDPGMVRIVIAQDTGPDDDDVIVAVADLAPCEGLTVANRITRVVNLVYESAEDSPDLDREAAKYEVPSEPSP